MKKRIISLSLASTMLMGTVAFAGVNDMNLISESLQAESVDREVINVETEEEISKFNNYKGEITAITKEDEYLSITVDSSVKEDNEQTIVFNISDETLILSNSTQYVIGEDKLVEGATVEMFYGKDTPMTMSMPPQTNADVIVLEESEENTEIKALDKIMYEGKEINLENRMYKSDQVYMVSVRDLAEGLGYKVSWQNDTKQVELTKGNVQVTATADQDMYSFAKKIVKLGKASELKDGNTFVPVSFIEEVMGLDMEITQAGVINIK